MSLRPDAPPAYILDVATALPENVCTRDQALDMARAVFGAEPEALHFLQRLLEASNIEKRHTVIADYGQPAEARTFFAQTPDFRPEPGTQIRNQIFVREARVLAETAARRLAAKGWTDKVTHLITASCTGFSAPGFDVDLVRRLGLSPRVHRTHVGFMGCYAGFSTMKLAHTICQADPQALVLVVHVELCSLHVHFRSDLDTLIANSLFADGATAALIGGEAHGALATAPALRLCAAGAFLLPGGEDDMTWNIGDQGFDMTLSPRVPFVLRKHLPVAFEQLLDEQRLDKSQIVHWAIHPGGPAILEKACQALQIDESDVAVSREILRDHGNMSSCTIWFVLDEIRKRREPGYVYACGFGPGLTLESSLLHHPGAQN